MDPRAAPPRLLSVLTAASLLAAGPATAQVLGQGDEPSPTGGTPTVQVDDDRAADAAAALLARIGAEDARPSLAEWLRYVQLVEQHPPNQRLFAESQAELDAMAEEASGLAGRVLRDARVRPWAMIASKMHDDHYPEHREGNTYVVLDLFEDGPENHRWQEVDLLVERSPEYAVASDGTLVKVSHTYAGVAALVGRSGIGADFWSNLNTDWGDRLQRKKEQAKDVIRTILGRERGDPDATRSPDQVHGNYLGRNANEFLQRERDAALSEALTAAVRAWNQRDEAQDGGGGSWWRLPVVPPIPGGVGIPDIDLPDLSLPDLPGVPFL